jgi:hypothetical protein
MSGFLDLQKLWLPRARWKRMVIMEGNSYTFFGFVSESIDGPWYPWSCLATNSDSQNSTDEMVIQSFPAIRGHHRGLFSSCSCFLFFYFFFHTYLSTLLDSLNCIFTLSHKPF